MRKDNLLVFKRGAITVAMNLSEEVQEIEKSGQVIMLSSGVLEGGEIKKLIPARSSIWILH